jgi:RNA polymerase sigma factor (sigma-70 family)
MVASLAPVDYAWQAVADFFVAGDEIPEYGLEENDRPRRTALGYREAPQPDEHTDSGAATLLTSIANGNTEAFWPLWELYREHLFRLCLKTLCGVREDAEDALSLAMLKARDKLPVFAAEVLNVRAWLCRLTYNQCIDLHRERKIRRRHLESIEQLFSGSKQPASASSHSPEMMLLHAETNLCLKLAVKAMPKRLYEPFAMHFYQNMPYTSIGKSLAISPANARKRIQQARIFLQARLKRTNGRDLAARRIRSRLTVV